MDIHTLFGRLLNDFVYIIIKLQDYDIHIHKHFQLYKYTHTSVSQSVTDIDNIINIFESQLAQLTQLTQLDEPVSSKIKIKIKYNNKHSQEAIRILDVLEQLRILYAKYDIRIKTYVTYD